MTILSTIQHMASGFLDLATTLAANNDGGGSFPNQGDVNKALTDSGPAFRVVQAVFSVIGVGVVIWTIKGVVTALIGANPMNAVKKLIGGLVAAILCFRLSLPLTLVEGLGSLLSKVFESFNNTLKNN